MLDVKEGDALVIGAKNYTIRRVHEWHLSRHSATSFARLATLSASTKRAQIVGTMRGGEGTYLSNLKSTPLYPISAELKASLVIDDPVAILESFLGDSTGVVRVFVEDKK